MALYNLHCVIVIILAIMLIKTFHFSTEENETSKNQAYDPCCSYPCQHLSVCLSYEGGSYECDCTGTGYYGTNCETAYLKTKLMMWMKPSKDTLHWLLTNFHLAWKIVNNVSWIRRSLMKAILKVRIGFIVEPSPYNAITSYPSWESYENKTVYVRQLPAIPINCPTPMGVKGEKELPDVDVLIERFFERRLFKPCSRRTSVIFPLFAQHFTHQFFQTDVKKGLPFQWGHQTLDLSHIYGHSYERQHQLRLHKDGKMKYSIVNNEMFPPNVEDANITMDGVEKIPKEFRFAIGHPGFAVQPTVLFFATLWLREHNRVCDIVKEEHPSWDDERLFQTARLILTGETLKIVVEDYVQHLSGYNYKLIYDPELLHSSGLSYHNEIAVEFQLLYRWHALMPDHFLINNQTLGIRNLIFNPGPFVQAGMSTWYRDAANQFAGQVSGGRTQGRATLGVARQAILDGRRLRLQPFNKYRERFGLKPYKSFTEFIEDADMAKELEELYGDVDAMEYFTGIMLERRKPPLLFGQTLTELGSPSSLKGIFSNPIGSPAWWKPSSFGGSRGFDIVKTASLKRLICNNIEGCPHGSFEVLHGKEYKDIIVEQNNSDNSSQILMKINRGYNVPDEIKPRLDVSKRQPQGH